MAAPDASPRTVRPRRTIAMWLASLIGAAVLAWLASREMPLWPEQWYVPEPAWLGAGVALYAPYVWLRSVRLRFLLDPLVQADGTDADAVGARRFAARALHGSGLVSFFVVMALPLRLGELSRPVLLTKAEEPGVGFAESASAVGTERAIDGLAIVGLVFAGLALAPPASVAQLEHVQSVGRITAWVMVGGLALLLAFSRAPHRLEALVDAVVPGRAGARLSSFAGRVAGALAPIWRPSVFGPLVATTVAYWAVTVLQLQWVARGCGVEVDLAMAAVVVAVVGLSIQLPGGPAQLGSFQLGMAMALGLYLDPGAHPGAVSFGVAMYTLQLAGAALFAVPGAWLMASHERARSAARG